MLEQQLLFEESTSVPRYENRLSNVALLSQPLIPSQVFCYYWHLASERQKIFFRRLEGHTNWTNDPILKNYRFTNSYRASDRVSQYLIRNVLYDQKWSKKELFFRCLLFKLFNKTETWELIKSEIGNPTTDNFDVTKISELLLFAKKAGERIYSSAYIMPSGGKGIQKHDFHLKTINELLNKKFWKYVSEAESLKKLYELLLEIPGLGPFLAFQYTIDLNYSEIINFCENEFIVAGPGALSGIRKCFINSEIMDAKEIITFVTEKQDAFFEALDIGFPDLMGRKLHLIDCQNLFCEIDKYSRVMFPQILGNGNRKRIKRVFKNPQMMFNPFYPPKWNISYN